MIEGHQLDIREIYESSRLGAFLSILPHISKSDRQSLTPQKLIKFEWEKDAKANKIDPDEMKKDLEHFAKIEQLIKEGKVKIKPKENGKS